MIPRLVRRMLLGFALAAASATLVALAVDHSPPLQRAGASALLVLAVASWLSPNVPRRPVRVDCALQVFSVLAAGLLLPAPSPVLALLFAAVARCSVAVDRPIVPVLPALFVAYLIGVAGGGGPVGIPAAVVALAPVPGLVITAVAMRMLARALEARAAAEERAARATARLQTLIDTTPAGVAFVDRAGRVELWNQAAERFAGRPADEVVGGPLPAGLFGPDAEDWTTVLDRLRDRGPEVGREVTWQRDLGGPVHLSVSAAAVPDPAGGLAGAVAVLADVTQARRLERQLKQRELLDRLTGLATREGLTDWLAGALAVSERADPIALITLDLDGFRAVNERFGSIGGDQVLAEVAGRIRRVADKAGVVARFGGNQYSVALRCPDQDAALTLARTLVEVVGLPLYAAGVPLAVPASAGVVLSRPGAVPAELLRDAESALLAAKRAGGGHVQLFRSELYGSVMERLTLQTDLHRAVRDGDLAVHYRPVTDLRSGRVTAFDAQLRWRHPERGSLLARQFMAVAEDSGLAVPLGRRLLVEAAARVSDWRSECGDQLALGVTVTPTQLREPDFAAGVLAVLAGAGLAPDRLQLNLTGRMLLDPAAAVLEPLRAAGVRIALDRFGAGRDDLTALRRPIEQVRMDPRFTRVTAAHDPSVLAGVLGLVHGLGLTAVVRGLDTEEQVAVVRRLGGRLGQGDALGLAGPAEVAGAGRPRFSLVRVDPRHAAVLTQ